MSSYWQNRREIEEKEAREKELKELVKLDFEDEGEELK